MRPLLTTLLSLATLTLTGCFVTQHDGDAVAYVRVPFGLGASCDAGDDGVRDLTACEAWIHVQIHSGDELIDEAQGAGDLELLTQAGADRAFSAVAWRMDGATPRFYELASELVRDLPAGGEVNVTLELEEAPTETLTVETTAARLSLVDPALDLRLPELSASDDLRLPDGRRFLVEGLDEAGEVIAQGEVTMAGPQTLELD